MPEEFERGMSRGLQNIRQAALDGEVELLYVDETGMSCQPTYSAAGHRRGKPHCTDASSSNRRVNVLGRWTGAEKLHYHLHEGARAAATTQF